MDSIAFPNLGIFFRHVPRGLQIGSFEIAFYGMIVAAGMLAGIYLAMWIARKTGQDPDLYFNFAVITVILSVIGARIYYVLFSWDYYGSHLSEIADIRGGGLAIYGGVITGVLCAVIYTKKHGMKLLLWLDTAMPAVALGQAVGRWGNFFNREAFGGYTDSLMAMRLPMEAISENEVTLAMRTHAYAVDGVSYVQVHPAFFYESVWNLALVGLMLYVTLRGSKNRTDPEKSSAQRKRSILSKRFDGQIFCMYLAGYGLGRFWIEGLRTDQLKFWGTGIAVSQVLSALLVIAGAAGLAAGFLSGRASQEKN